MEIIYSNKRGNKLCLDGYMYVIHHVNDNDIRWRCSQASSRQCKAALTTDLDVANPSVIRSHNHAADDDGVTAVKATDAMKTRARDTLADPAQIFAQAVQNLPTSTRARLPLENSLKRTLRNQKAKENPTTPGDLRNLTIEGTWTLTGGAESVRFLLYDNGPEAEERIIIFATDEFLELLGTSKEWYMDGNFSLAPSFFLQLYVIRVETRGLYVTVAYCILERKSTETYLETFGAIMDKCAERDISPEPRLIHMDFEKAPMRAAKEIFGDNVKISGCFYHLTQSTYRKVQSLKLQTQYLEDEELNKFCGMLDGLAFLPVNEVHEGMSYLQKICPPEAEALVKYFDETYVNGTSRSVGQTKSSDDVHPAKVRRIAPQFPPEVWNALEITMDRGDRTNNRTEGWNHRFARIVGVDHPSIWTLIEKMRQEVAVDCTKLAQYSIGRQNKKSTAHKTREDQIFNICDEYCRGEQSLADFLKAISSAIRFRSYYD